jgi:hypothetical protein
MVNFAAASPESNLSAQAVPVRSIVAKHQPFTQSKVA